MLADASCDATELLHVILDMRVHLHDRFEAKPDEIRQPAISVAELAGKSVRRESFFGRLIHALDRCYGELEESGFARLAPRWEAHFSLRGREVRVESLGQSITGTALGIDHDGALMIEDAQ